MSTERRLVSTRRRVPEEERERYDALWARLNAAATARGAHAWRFVSAERADVFVEFLEYRDGADPREQPQAAAALRELSAAFGDPPPRTEPVEEWREPPPAG